MGPTGHCLIHTLLSQEEQWSYKKAPHWADTSKSCWDHIWPKEGEAVSWSSASLPWEAALQGEKPYNKVIELLCMVRKSSLSERSSSHLPHTENTFKSALSLEIFAHIFIFFVLAVNLSVRRESQWETNPVKILKRGCFQQCKCE